MHVKEEIRKYWNSRSASYDKSPGHAALPELWKKILREVFDKRCKILDVGTGTGFIAILLSELGHEVIGIDLSEGMLEVAKRKAEKAGVSVTFKIGDAENLPFADESFDAVICRHVLWTLPNPKKAIEEWKRVVKVGGEVVVIDGKWHSNTFSDKVLKSIGKLGMAIIERRNVWEHYSKEVSKVLPFDGGVEMERVVELFKSAGLCNVSTMDLNWLREEIVRRYPIFYRLSWRGKSYFLVRGCREV